MTSTDTTGPKGLSDTTTLLQDKQLYTLWGLVVFCALLAYSLIGISLLIFPKMDLTLYKGTELYISAAPLSYNMAIARFVLLSSFCTFLIWKRPRDRVVLIFASGFYCIGALSIANIYLTASPDALPFGHILRLMASLNIFLALTAALSILLYLPNGRFSPPWSRYLLLPWSGYAIYHTYTFWSTSKFPGDLMMITLIVGGVNIGLQVRRYRMVATYQERQQIKWLALGMGWAFVLQGIVAPWFNPFKGNPSLLQEVSFFLVITASYVIAIGAFTLALIRYRLWDMDIALNRSLVYGSLFLGLLAIFGGGFWGLKLTFVAVLGSENRTLAAVLAMGLAAGSFQPALRWVRRIVDQRIFGIAIDYRQFAKPEDPDATPDFHSNEATTPQPTALLLNQYLPISQLGKGGMGEVTLAEHKDTGQRVAIKRLLNERLNTQELQKRFDREANILAQLEHPNIIKLIEHGLDPQNQQLYMVMEYIEGDDLSDVIEEHGPFPLGVALPLLREVASALDYAHQRGVIHRDIKPSNVMMLRSTVTPGSTVSLEGYNSAILMDFGIARSKETETDLTHDNKFLGTPQYIAPEQIHGARHVDGRADIYAFGIMSYLLVTGRLPFEQDHLFSLMMAHLSQPPPDPRAFAPTLTRHAAKAILRALHKKPDGRFPTANAFVDAMAERSPT